MLWQRRISSRHQLARLDSRLLADAGISEAQRYEELSKPFWRCSVAGSDLGPPPAPELKNKTRRGKPRRVLSFRVTK
jgi:hypothetical protein